MTLQIILGILLAGLLSNNYPILYFLGTGAVVENERTAKRSLLLGLGTTIVMVLGTLATWPIEHFLLHEMPYLRTLVFVAVLMVIVGVLHLIIKNSVEKFCHVDFVKFALNGAVLGLCIHNAHHTFAEALVTAVAVGIGFIVAMTVFAELYHRIDEESVPKAFRGFPINLLIAGMMALCFLAF